METIPNMDEAQISFLANEITKSFMEGKNTGTFRSYTEEYITRFMDARLDIIKFLHVNTKEKPEDYDIAVGYKTNSR